MIFPFFNDLSQWAKVPVTWALFALNLFVFICVAPAYNTCQNQIESILENEHFLKTQGQIYAEMILANQTQFEHPLVTLADHLTDPTSDNDEILGRLAIRNSIFMANAVKFHFRGDRISYAFWRKQFQQYENLQFIHPSFTMGYLASAPGWHKMITYQFVHGGFTHLFVNMIVLILLGSYLEPLVGPVFFLVAYLLSGIGAALTFAYFNHATPVPLVGASGSIMGLLGILAVVAWGRKLRFIWLLPTRTFVGYLWLPSWIFVVYLIATDIAGVIETTSWLGTGIAHWAHIGGFSTGIVAGILLLLFYRPEFPGERVIHREQGLDALLAPIR